MWLILKFLGSADLWVFGVPKTTKDLNVSASIQYAVGNAKGVVVNKVGSDGVWLNSFSRQYKQRAGQLPGI